MEIRTFADFWPYYVRAHSRPRTRILHAIGSILALACYVMLWKMLTGRMRADVARYAR